MNRQLLQGAMLACALIAAGAQADNRSRLYTAPTPAAAGGIRGRVTHPTQSIETILALPPDAPEQVYQGTLTDAAQRQFLFEGLPMRNYDLIVIYRDRFYEGLRLQRGDSTLTPEDRHKIAASIAKSEPFFNHKFVHRIEGETGRGNLARAVVTYLAAKPLQEQPRDTPHRRTVKLVLLKDVGPGWQIVRTRDLYPKSIPAAEGRPAHHYVKPLSGIRVTNYIKDVGDLNLERSDP